MLIKLKYTNVGVKKFNGIIEHKAEQSKAFDSDYIAELAYYDIKKQKCCMSKDIECVYCMDTNKGTIYANSHNIGTFEWITNK